MIARGSQVLIDAVAVPVAISPPPLRECTPFSEHCPAWRLLPGDTSPSGWVSEQHSCLNTCSAVS